MRRNVRILGWAMVWTGLLSFGLIGYQLFVTDFINERVQADARIELAADLEERRAVEVEAVVVEEPAVASRADTVTDPIEFFPESAVAESEPFAELRIPAIDASHVLFEGVTPSTLQLGPGHMPWTPLPGQPGNAVLSGHRTTYGAPFFDLDQLEEGDVMEVDSVIGTHEYTVREILIVTPTDVWVTEPRDGAWLTLTTCHPKWSAAQRLIIVAEMTAGPNLDYTDFLTTQVAP